MPPPTTASGYYLKSCKEKNILFSKTVAVPRSSTSTLLPSAASVEALATTVDNPAAGQRQPSVVECDTSSRPAQEALIYTEVKQFLAMDTVAVRGAPEPNAAQIEQIEIGKSFIACAEVTVGLNRTMLRIHLESNGAQDPWNVTYGWVSEEDQAGSCVCVDLGWCLRPPIGQRANIGQNNVFHDGYYRVTADQLSTWSKLSYTEQKRRVGGYGASIIWFKWYQLAGEKTGMFTEGTIVKALQHQPMRLNKAAQNLSGCVPSCCCDALALTPPKFQETVRGCPVLCGMFQTDSN